MKSEERHELETNALAKFLGDAMEKIRPYTSFIIYGLLAIVAVWAIVRLSSGSMSAKHEEAWNSYTIATLPGKFEADRLEAAAEQYAGEPVGELARIAWADSQLAQGCARYFIDKESAMKNLTDAQKAYEKLAAEGSDEMLRQRAQFGGARALEAKGEVEAAVEAYGKVEGALSQLAEVRIEQLNEMNASDYADWLAQAEGARQPGAMGGAPRPDFSPDDLDLPGGPAASGGSQSTEDFLELLEQMNESLPEQPPEQPSPEGQSGQPGIQGPLLDLDIGEEAPQDSQPTTEPETAPAEQPGEPSETQSADELAGSSESPEGEPKEAPDAEPQPAEPQPAESTN